MANTAWNPSDLTNITLSGSNLTATSTGQGGVRAVDKQITGKFYWEMTATTVASNDSFGLAMGGVSLVGSIGVVYVVQSGTIFVNATNTGVTIGSIATGGTKLCIAVDIDANLIWFRVGAAGNWNGNAGYAPNTGVGGVNFRAAGGGPAIPMYPYLFLNASSRVVTANFGDTAFTGAVPAGFTSGFTAGATPPVNALATQSALEQFFAANPFNQTTQVGLEMWASTATGPGQNMVTQTALEMWASVAEAGRLKVWNGSTWNIKPAKVWSGSAWVTKPVKVWNGSAWV